MAIFDKSLVKMANYLNRQMPERELVPEVSLACQSFCFNQISKCLEVFLCEFLMTDTWENKYIAVEFTLKKIQQLINLIRLTALQNVKKSPCSLVKLTKPTVIRENSAILKILDRKSTRLNSSHR